MAIYSTKKLTYKNILNDINITIPKNKITLISGSNRSGKTTLIKILSGIISTKDTVFYGKDDIFSMSSNFIYKTISSVFDYDINSIFPSMEHELLYTIEKIKADKDSTLVYMDELLDLFDIKNYLHTSISSLSEVIKLKFTIVKKLLVKPKILMMDNILDSINCEYSFDIIDKLKKISDLTVIISSNNLELSPFSDYLIILDKGKVLLSDDTKKVLKNDSILNKCGLKIPFMVDLSLKLKYYGLVDDIYLDMDRMIDVLWK